jgi:hypothetical protein
LARFKHPRDLIVMDELPRNTMGKVQKNILRELVPGFASADTASRQDTGKQCQRASRSSWPKWSSAEDAVTFTAIGTGFALRSVTLRAPSSGEITELEHHSGRQIFKR